ncbi:TPA: hypothetical protein ACG3KH_004348, partial [Clostridioides difficile]
MKKKLGYILGSMTLGLALVLSGCGANSNESATTGDQAASTTATTVDNASAGSTEPQEKVTLTISAAASLTDAMGEIEKGFESENPNIDLSFNFGASGALQ